MKRLALTLAAALLGATSAAAQPPGYATRETQIGATRIIEHAPTTVPVLRPVRRARVAVARRRPRAAVVATSGVSRVVALSEKQEFYPNSAIAGGCRDGGIVRRLDPSGVVVLRQREICHGIAPLASRRWAVAAQRW